MVYRHICQFGHWEPRINLKEWHSERGLWPLGTNRVSFFNTIWYVKPKTKNWYICFSNKHVAIERKNKVKYLYFHLILYNMGPNGLGADLTGADLTWGRFELLPIEQCKHMVCSPLFWYISLGIINDLRKMLI